MESTLILESQRYAQCWCGKEEKEIGCGEGKEHNTLLRDDLRGWVDSAAIIFLKGVYIYINRYISDQIFHMIGFLIAGFTDAINHVIHYHLHLTSALALPPFFI